MTDPKDMTAEELRQLLVQKETAEYERLMAERREARERELTEQRAAQARAMAERSETLVKLLQPVIDAINAARPKEFDDSYLVAAKAADYGTAVIAWAVKPEQYRSTRAEFRDDCVVITTESGNSSRFPKGKHGYNAANIAGRFWNEHTAVRRQKEREAVRAENVIASKKLAEELRAEYGWSEYDGHVRACEGDATKVIVNFRIEGYVTPERARQIFDGLRALGLIKAK